MRFIGLLAMACSLHLEGARDRPDTTIDWMNEARQILQQIGQGEGGAAEQLVPLIYNELRRLAARHIAAEKPGQTLDATALVHEAYLRLVGEQQFENRRHFFAAAGESMRRILVERARARRSLKGGGGRTRVDLESAAAVEPERSDELLAVDAALDRLAAVEPEAAQLVKLRYFAGCTMKEAADLLGMSLRSSNRLWAYAKAWLVRELRPE
jgi:RNA polymerase sigma factor (TIGR02999 family)